MIICWSLSYRYDRWYRQSINYRVATLISKYIIDIFTLALCGLFAKGRQVWKMLSLNECGWITPTWRQASVYGMSTLNIYNGLTWIWFDIYNLTFVIHNLWMNRGFPRIPLLYSTINTQTFSQQEGRKLIRPSTYFHMTFTCQIIM